MKLLKNLVLSMSLVAGIWTTISMNNKAEAGVVCLAVGAVPCAIIAGGVGVAGMISGAYLLEKSSLGGNIPLGLIGLGIGSAGLTLALLGDDNMDAKAKMINSVAETIKVSLDAEVIEELAVNAEVKEVQSDEGIVTVLSISSEVVMETMEFAGYNANEINVMTEALR